MISSFGVSPTVVFLSEKTCFLGRSIAARMLWLAQGVRPTAVLVGLLVYLVTSAWKAPGGAGEVEMKSMEAGFGYFLLFGISSKLKGIEKNVFFFFLGF